ncbi:MAG: ABC transporter permease subunit [Verrucomicrobia bacterium]|nr:ABC transporter permease subunit [Verrucomicrobiota bacterium]
MPHLPPTNQSPLRIDTSWWRKFRTLRDEPPVLEGWVFGLVGILTVLGLWWLVTLGDPVKRWVDPYTLPSPAETFGSFPELWERGLSISALTSLLRVCGGFVIAAAIGVPLGLLSGSYPRVGAFFKPFGIFGRNVPIAALIALTLVWFGLGELQKVMFIFLAAVAFVLFDTTSAARSVPDRFLETAYTLGARHNWTKGLRLAAGIAAVYALLASVGWSWLKESVTLASEAATAGFWIRALAGFVLGFGLWFPLLSHQVLRKVVVPMAMPDVVNSLRLLFGLAFGYIMLAEVINAKRGLGALIITSQRQGPREHVYLCLIIIALLAWGIDRMILMVQRQAFPYLKHGQD